MDAVEQKILNILREMTDLDIQDLNVSLRSLGLDSIDCLDFLHQIKEEFDISLQWDAKDFANLNISEIIADVRKVVS